MTDLDPIQPPPPPPPPSKLSDPAYLFVGADGLRAGWSISIFLVLFPLVTLLCLLIAAKLLHQPFPPNAAKEAAIKFLPARATIVGKAFELLAISGATFLMALIERRRNAVYGLGGTNRLRQFLQGLATGILCLSVLVLLLRLTGVLHFDGLLLTTPAAFRYGLIWLAGFFLVGFGEEYLFRGFLQFALARGLAGLYGAIFKTRHRHTLGFWTAAILISLLFGAAHKTNPGESPFGLIAVVLAGLFFSLALYRTGSLWWAIGFHTTWDWAQSFLYGVPDSGLMVQGHLFATHISGAPYLSGGLTGPEGSVLIVPALLLGTAIIFTTLPKKEENPQSLPDAH